MFIIAIFSSILSSCSSSSIAVPPTVLSSDPPITPPPVQTHENSFYVDSSIGSDLSTGTFTSPWQTIQKAVKTAQAGDTIYIRGGNYTTIFGGWSFQNSGTRTRPITLTNYPGEQVVIEITQPSHDYRAFGCWYAPPDPPDWQTTKADFIRIIGSDVAPHVLSNGTTSHKGIVIQGVPGITAGIEVGGDCDNWEVAGIDFVDVGYAIFTKKRVFRTTEDNSPNYWYVHNNRVYGFYRESGMQFNGNYNRIENNEIYKVDNQSLTPYGCQLLNINGNNNIISRNTLSRSDSTIQCLGILLEWDLADKNIIEQNTISNIAGNGSLVIAGGDNNVIRQNTIYAASSDWFYIYPDRIGFTGWPCNEETNDVSDIPANNPAAPDYQYYYPHNCSSVGNQIYGNTVIKP